MGLHAVELLLTLEATFGIELPDEEISSVRTAGELHHLIMAKLDPGSAWESSLAWETMRRVLAEQACVDHRTITPSTDLVRDLGYD